MSTVQQEIIERVVRDVVKTRSHMSNVPSTLKSDFRMPFGVTGGAVSGVGGALVGAHFGLAGFFGAIPATWPLAIAAVVIGGLASSKLGERIVTPVSTDNNNARQEFCATCGLPR